MTFHRRGTRPLHVLVFGVRWPPETFLRAKFERLAERGVHVTIACPDLQRNRGAALAGVRVELVVPTDETGLPAVVAAVLRLALTRPRRLRAVARGARRPTGDGRVPDGRDVRHRLRAYARLASLRPDLVHFEWDTAAVHFHSLPDALGCNSIVSVRGSVRPSSLAAGFPVAFRRAAAVHCVSETVAEEHLGRGLPQAKARVIRPAVDPSRFAPVLRPPGETFRVLGIGWLHWWKGWEYALGAIARLAVLDTPVRFDIVGPEPHPDMGAPSDLARLRHAIEDLGLRDRVIIHGGLDRDAVRALLDQADVLLHASVTEGAPNVVLEAMACGLPVVATDVGGTRELLDDGVEGLLVPPRNPAAAAEALAVLWRDPERRRGMGRAGRARVEAEHTLDRRTNQWVELYEEVASLPPPCRSWRLVEVGLDWPPEAFLRRKLEGLAERGAEVAVASLLPQRNTPRPIPEIAIERLPHEHESRRPELVGAAADALKLLVRNPRRLVLLLGARPAHLGVHLRLALLRADVAHFEWASFARVYPSLLGMWRFPTVLSCHGSEVLVRPFTARAVDLPSLFPRFDAVLCVSRAVQAGAEAQGLAPSTARIIHSAVDPNVFRPPPRSPAPDGRFVVITVSTLRWVKGYEHALLAIAHLVDDGVPVVYEIVGSEPGRGGDAPERARLLAAVSDLGLDERIRFRGWLDERSVVEALQQADAYFQASLSEGMPTAVLEAMACGLPVVATDVGGTREAVTDGVEGYLVPPRAPRAAAEALASLWHDAERRRTMGRTGRARVQAEFTLEQQLDRFEALYREVAS